ncbi:MAG: DUF2934 domain-containing protein [Candidatus Korobacteraceae bacterium]
MDAYEFHSTSHHVREPEQSIPEQRIRERAYQIYQQRGAKGGHAEGDWLTAEAELKEIKKKAGDSARVAESLKT